MTLPPQAGTTNPTVELFIVELNGIGSRGIKVETPIDKVSSDHILGTVFWIDDENLGAIWLNRRQDRAVFVSYDTSTASSSHQMSIVRFFILHSYIFSVWEEQSISQHNVNCFEIIDLEWQIFTTNRWWSLMSMNVVGLISTRQNAMQIQFVTSSTTMATGQCWQVSIPVMEQWRGYQHQE